MGMLSRFVYTRMELCASYPASFSLTGKNAYATPNSVKVKAKTDIKHSVQPYQFVPWIMASMLQQTVSWAVS